MPILYGSQGVSLYIGNFKQFGDIDLLVDDRLLGEDWRLLIATMEKLGFTLDDEREHEFSNEEGTTVAFAGKSILMRDNIAQSVDEAIGDFLIEGKKIQTLTPEAFLRAYEHSVKDGYRKDVRGKKDSEIILLIKASLTKA